MIKKAVIDSRVSSVGYYTCWKCKQHLFNGDVIFYDTEWFDRLWHFDQKQCDTPKKKIIRARRSRRI